MAAFPKAAVMTMMGRSSALPENPSRMYDLICDIHGHADPLQRLLHTLGYTRRAGVYRHPERQAIFLG